MWYFYCRFGKQFLLSIDNKSAKFLILLFMDNKNGY